MLTERAATRFEDLIVWQKAHHFVIAVYRASGKLPKQETYGLIGQMRRSAVSVAANIVEGFKKRSRRDKVRFLNIAQASLEESRYYLILMQDLGYGCTTALSKQAEEISRMLEGYIKGIENTAS